MQTYGPITDPRNGQPTTIHELARATGIRSHIIWQRWEVWGIRSLMLISPPGTEIDKVAEQRWAWRQWLRPPLACSAPTASATTAAPTPPPSASTGVPHEDCYRQSRGRPSGKAA